MTIPTIPGVSVVIPVFRAEHTLPTLCHELTEALSDAVEPFEIIFVEDGGGDRSWPIIVGLAAQDPRVRGLRMSRNYGQHNALLCGIRAARFDIILTMDDDLQHPVSEIAAMLRALTPEYAVVYGTPEQQQHGLLRNLASSLTKAALSGAMGAATARDVSAFRVFRTRLRDGFANYGSPFVSIDVLLTWTTTRFTSIKVRHAPRATGASGYTLGKLIRHSIDLMTGFSTLPLKVSSLIGFVFVAFGGLILAIVLVNYMIRSTSVPGFAFLASIITIFAGAQLFALGVIGEYLARMHFRSMDRPTYLIDESTPALGAADMDIDKHV